MATYTIQVSYTPTTTGCHTICYQETGNLANTCCIQDINITPSMVGIVRNFIFTPGVTPCTSGVPTIPVGPGPGSYTYTGNVKPCLCDFPVNWGPVEFIVP